MSAEPVSFVHGLSGDQVAPDWPLLGEAEARAVLGRWGLAGAERAAVRWRSPRPQSAAGIVATATDAIFVKRHDARVRDEASLCGEHRFAAWLRARGVQVPRVLATPDGATAVCVDEGPLGARVYEVHELAPGIDAYRDALSWTGFRSVADASGAGVALARLHLAAAGFAQAARPFGPLVDSCAVVAAPDPVAAIRGLVAARPGLAAGLAGFEWERSAPEALGGWLSAASAALAGLPTGWTHGDWHPSNLTWSAPGRPLAVLDLGLANRTLPVRDLAIAIERAGVSWLEGSPVADLAAVRGLLDGYASVRPLSADERAALVAVLPVVHVEFALSEVEYYGGVLGDSSRAQLAYRGYLIGHADWFATDAGARLLDAVGGA